MLGGTILRWLHRALAALRHVVDRAIAVVERELPEAPPVAFEPAEAPAARTATPSGPPEHWLRMVRERAPHLLRGEGEGTTLWRTADHAPRPEPQNATRAGTPADPDGPTGPTSPSARPRAGSWADAEHYRTRRFRPPPGRRTATPRTPEPPASDDADGPDKAMRSGHPRHGEVPGAEHLTGTRRPSDLEAGASPPPRLTGPRADAGVGGLDARVGDAAHRDRGTGAAAPDLQPRDVRTDAFPSRPGVERAAAEPQSEGPGAVKAPLSSPPAFGPWDGGDGPHPRRYDAAVAPAWPDRAPARHAERAPASMPEAHDPWPELPPLDTSPEAAALHLRATLDLQRHRERVRREQEGRLWSE